MTEFKPYDLEAGKQRSEQPPTAEAQEIIQPDIDQLALEASSRSDLQDLVSAAETKMGAIKAVRTVLQSEAEAARAASPQITPKSENISSGYTPPTDYLVAKQLVELLWRPNNT